jgi:hypothetical protein
MSETTWRDLADQLTPEQIANVEKTEQFLVEHFPDDDPAAGMLDLAQTLVRRNMGHAIGIPRPRPTAEESQALWELLINTNETH